MWVSSTEEWAEAVAEAGTAAGAWVEVETGAEAEAGTADSQPFDVSTCETNMFRNYFSVHSINDFLELIKLLNAWI